MRKMEGPFGFLYCLLLLAVSQVFAENSDCFDFGYWYSSDNSNDPHLYLKYEEALIKDHSQLEELRAAFISDTPHYVDLNVHMSAVILTNTSCGSNNFENPTFCSTSQYTWASCTECPLQVKLAYTPNCMKIEQQLPNFAVLFVSLMHGSSTGFHWPLYLKLYIAENFYDAFNYYYSCYDTTYTNTIELNLDYLGCNPSCDSTQRVLSDMLSWVSGGQNT